MLGSAPVKTTNLLRNKRLTCLAKKVKHSVPIATGKTLISLKTLKVHVVVACIADLYFTSAFPGLVAFN